MVFLFCVVDDDALRMVCGRFLLVMEVFGFLFCVVDDDDALRNFMLTISGMAIRWTIRWNGLWNVFCL